jgi:hypothetical protein
MDPAIAMVKFMPPLKLAPTIQAADSIVVGTFQDEQSHSAASLAVLAVPLVRDTLRDNNIELLSTVSSRPLWRVPLAELQDWYFFLGSSGGSSSVSQPSLLNAGEDGQSCTTELFRSVLKRRARRLARPLTVLHPWQHDPHLSVHVFIDLLNHLPKRLQCPAGWKVLQRNDSALITAPGRCSMARRSMECYLQCMEDHLANLSSLQYFASPMGLLSSTAARGC